MESRTRTYERKPFDRARCDQCGICLSTCPVMHLPEDAAQAAIAALPEYLEEKHARPAVAERVLRDCTSCFACNIACPHDCRPANLVLDIWHRQYQQEGLPARAGYFLPHSQPNFRSYVIARLPEDEKGAVESWKRLDPAEEIFFPGCNMITAPYLTFSSLFDGLDIRGGIEYCCGEMYFRMGLYEQVEQVARKTTIYFRQLGVRRVHMLCTAGLNLFSHVLPQCGADFSGIEFLSFLKTLDERLRTGELPIVKRFDGQTITVQDSCHAKVYEADYDQWPRRILEFLGFEILEAPQRRDAMVCCGIGSGFSHTAAYGKRAMMTGQKACLANSRKAGADCTAAYCAGCLQMLSVARLAARTAPPVYHLIELVQKAIGEAPARRQRRTAIQFLKGTLMNQSLGGKRFLVPPIK